MSDDWLEQEQRRSQDDQAFIEDMRDGLHLAEGEEPYAVKDKSGRHILIRRPDGSVRLANTEEGDEPWHQDPRRFKECDNCRALVQVGVKDAPLRRIWCKRCPSAYTARFSDGQWSWQPHPITREQWEALRSAAKNQTPGR